MLNHITIMGRLTADPELRQTPNGTSCASFTLAVDRDYKPEGGEREADFINCVAWRGTADFVSKYFSKGRMAVVSGRLQVRKWQNKEGENRYATEVIADNVYFGDSKKEESSGGNSASASSDYSANGFDMKEEPDEDFPF